MTPALFAALNSIKADDVGIPKVAADANTFNAILGMVYTLIAAFAIFYIVRAALLYVTSANKSGDIQQARDTILYAVGALFGSTLVFGLLYFVINNLFK